MAPAIKKTLAMSGGNYLPDTNIIVYALKGLTAVKPYFEEDCYVSVITEIEILGVEGLSKKKLLPASQPLIFARLSL